eukprot:5163309-Prymnesium_polylepis.1
MHMSRSTETEHETELCLNCVRQSGITGWGAFPVSDAQFVSNLHGKTPKQFPPAAGICIRRCLRRTAPPTKHPDYTLTGGP